MSGLPGSGKTTRAREIVKTSGNTIRVNRDDLREMFFESKWSGHREKFVIKAEKILVTLAKECGFSSVVDDTNLHSDIWGPFAKENQLSLVREDLPTSLEECVQRDRCRERTVGRSVIENFARRSGRIDWGRHENLVLVDLDGTLADLSHRLHFMETTPKDHNEFFRLVTRDKVIEPVAKWVRNLIPEYTVVIVSGRPETAGADSIKWLGDNRINFSHIFMRRGGDHRPDDVVKQEILNDLPKDKIAFVIDDRQSVVDMWRRNGLRVFQMVPW